MKHALRAAKEKMAKARQEAEAQAAADAEKKRRTAERKAEAERKAKYEADAAAEAARKFQEEADRALAERLALSVAEAARRQAQKEVVATSFSSSSQTKGIFIQLPGLDDLSAHMDAATTAQAERVIGCVESAQQSIINAVTSSATANKPDLSVVTELKSIMTTQNSKIDSLATLRSSPPPSPSSLKGLISSPSYLLPYPRLIGPC